MVNFYITVEVVLIGALFALIGKTTRMPRAESTVSIAIAACSCVFYLLDRRTKNLIKQSEECIRAIEDRLEDSYGDDFKLLKKVEKNTKGVIFRNTYSRVFLLVYLAIGVFGVYTFFYI